MDAVAYISVRGGSRSIARKNIMPLAGRPLVHWTIRAALGCPLLERVFVASEDAEIRSVAAEVADSRLAVIDRASANATDEASTEAALLEFAEAHTFGQVVLIQATNPLLRADDLSGALAKMRQSGADSLLSVTREHRFRWQGDAQGWVRPVNYDPTARPRRQQWQGELVENGAFYVTSRGALLRSHCRVSGRITHWEMAPETALALDEPQDWVVAESWLRAEQGATGIGERSRRAELVICDVDGVLTDAGMYWGAQGEVLKKFNTRDGMGLRRWFDAGFRAAIITGEQSPIVTRRAEKIGIADVHLGVQDKAAALDRVLADNGLSSERVAYIGDDCNDLPVLSRVGLAACPSDAEPAVRAVAHFICRRAGGAGCVRELIDMILAEKERAAG